MASSPPSATGWRPIPRWGGTVDLAMPESPEFITEAIDGAAGLKGAKVIVVLEYTADSPLG